jgi:copper transport protein
VIAKRFTKQQAWTIGFISAFFLILLLSPSMGNAHSNLEKTAPQPDDVLSAPTQVDLWFEDPVVIHSDSVKVLNSEGHDVTMGEPKHEQGNQQHVKVSLQEGLTEGAYKVNYNVIALDGYVMTGVYSFNIRLPKKAMEEDIGFKIVKNSPTDGEIANFSLKQIDLWFSQPAELSAIGVFGQHNDILTGESYVDEQDPRHIIVPIVGTPEIGTYQVTWYAKPLNKTSAEAIRDYVGVFYFSVDQVTSLVTDQTRPFIQPFYSGFGLKHIAHVLAFLGLLSLLGITWFQNMIASGVTETRKRIIAVILYSASLIGFSLLLFLRRLEMGHLSLQELLSIQFIWVPIVQLVLISLSFWVLRNKLQFLGYALGLLLWPFSTGHSTYPRYGGLLSTVLDIVHLFSISIWMGGLIALITFIPKENSVLWVKQTGSKYSKWAFWSMLFIALTGVGMTLQYLPAFSLRSLLISDWGKGLLLKVALTGVIIALALLQRRSIQRMGENVVTSLVRRGRLELLYGVFILFAAAILIESKPSAASQGIFPATNTAEGVSASVSINPIDVGKNDIYIRFKNAPEFTEVRVKLLMPPEWWKENSAFSLGNGLYKVTGNFLHGAGTMMMEVTAYKPDGSSIVFPFRIVVPGEMRFNETE